MKVPNNIPLANLILDGVEESQRVWDSERKTRVHKTVTKAVPGNERPEFLDLLRKMLDWNPQNRPSARELLKHPWFNSFSNQASIC